MIIKISGDRQQMAELAHDIRMLGYRFNHALFNVSPSIIEDKQCMTLLTHNGWLSYYKTLDPSTVFMDKDLKVHLPSHRQHFLTKLQEHPYGHEKQAS